MKARIPQGLALATLCILGTNLAAGAHHSEFDDSRDLHEVQLQSSRAQDSTEPQPVVVDALSTEFSTTIQNPDGSYEMTASSGPVNYLDSDGIWRPIDTDLKPSSAQGRFAASNVENNVVTKIPADGSETPIRVERQDSWVTMKMAGMDSAPDLDGATATFDDVEGASKVVYSVVEGGLKEDIILASPPNSAPEYSYTIHSSPDLTAALSAEGTVEFRNSKGAVKFLIPKGIMSDSSSTPADSDAVHYEMTGENGTWVLTVKPDFRWLTESTRVYPVTVDPTLTYLSRDCTIRSHLASSTSCGAEYLKAGRDTSSKVWRALLDFSIGDFPQLATVQAAAVSLYLDAEESGTGPSATYGLANAGKAWGVPTWNQSDAEGAWNGGNPTGGPIGNVLTLGGGTSGWKTFTGLGPAMKAKVTSPASWNGFVLKQIPEDTNKIIAFYGTNSYGTNSDKRPRLQITYTLPPPEPPVISGEVSVSPSPSPGSVTSLNPSLSVVGSDPDSPSIRAKFEVLDEEGNVSWVGTSPDIPNPLPRGPRTATMEMPAGKLEMGGRYAVRATITDGTSWSANSPDAEFIVEPEVSSESEVFEGDASDMDEAAINAVLVGAFDCLTETGVVEPVATVENTLGIVADGAFLPPTGQSPPPVSEECASAALVPVSDALDDLDDNGTSTVPAVKAELKTLRSRIEAGTLDITPLSLATTAQSPAAQSSSDCEYPDVTTFFKKMNEFSDKSMFWFITNANLELPCYFNWNHNYCTMAVDQGSSFNFKDSCRRHDYGYYNLKRVKNHYSFDAWTKRNKNVADEQFLRDMKESCKLLSIGFIACRARARVYYTAASVAFINTLAYDSPLTYVARGN